MFFDGNDYTVLGFAFAFVAAYLAVRARRRRASLGTAREFMNLCQARSDIQSRFEGDFEFGLVCLGIVTGTFGMIRSNFYGKVGLINSSLSAIALAVTVVVALAWITTRLVDCLARARYVPLICRETRQTYDHSIWALEHAYQIDEPPYDPVLRKATEGRTENAKKSLDTIADLLDEPRRDSETHAALVERLRRDYFS